MPFRLSNAPATFQHSLELILSVLRFDTFLVCLYGVLIFSRKLEVHIKHPEEVLTLLDNGISSLTIWKCQFSQKILDYLVHVLLAGCISIANDSTSKIADAKFPQNISSSLPSTVHATFTVALSKASANWMSL